VTFLPIVARELRTASRRRGVYWVRSGAALSIIVVGTWLFLLMRDSQPQQLALALFGILAGGAVLYCLLSGVRATADCLSEEKREGTLGLLFLTDLKGYDVVLGKLAATSLNALYGVLAVVPMLAVPLLLGGVTPGEFGRMAVVALNALYFSLSVGMCVSALSRSARAAIAVTFLVIFLFEAVLPGTGAVFAMLAKANAVRPIYLIPSAGFSFFMGFDVHYRTAPNLFWWSIGVTHMAAWIFLGLSALIVPRSWRDQPAGIARLRWRDRWQLWSYGNSAERRAFRARLLGANAFYWLAARARLKPAMVWGLLGLLGCGWTWGLVKFGSDWLSSPTYFATGIILNLLLKGWLASEVGRQLAEDRKRGALELLLSTPLTVKEILRGQRLALQRQFLGPSIAVLAICLVLMAATAHEAPADDERTVFLSWLAGMAVFATDLMALYYVGMWQALVSRNPNRAASASVARVLVLPWVVFALIALGISLGIVQRVSEPGENFFLGLWFCLGLATDIGFGGWARHKLLSEFRSAAAQRYTSRPGLWERLFKGSEQAGPVLAEHTTAEG